jgi:hypothetical protein
MLAPDALHRTDTDAAHLGHRGPCVVSPTGSASVCNTTSASTSAVSGGMRNGRVLSRSRPAPLPACIAPATARPLSCEGLENALSLALAHPATEHPVGLPSGASSQPPGWEPATGQFVTCATDSHSYSHPFWCCRPERLLLYPSADQRWDSVVSQPLASNSRFFESWLHCPTNSPRKSSACCALPFQLTPVASLLLFLSKDRLAGLCQSESILCRRGPQITK